MREEGDIWGEAKKLATNRMQWKVFVEALHSPKNSKLSQRNKKHGKS